MYIEAYNRLNHLRHQWSNEEEVRFGWLREFQQTLNIIFHAERGRADADYNQVVIEFKDKGLFHNNTESPKFREAIYNRLAKYIPQKSEKEGIPINEYIGIAIDGDSIAFACFPTVESKEIVYGPIMPLSIASVSLVMDTCKHANRRAVTERNLIEDFGHESQFGSQVMQQLADMLTESLNDVHNNKIKMLFYEWKTLYGQVADLSESQVSSILKTIGYDCSVSEQDRLSAILFVIHTYNSIIIKILAAEIVSKIKSISTYSDFAQNTIAFDDDEMISVFETELEKSEFYERANIKGFIEEPLFSWYIDAYKQQNITNRKLFADSFREILIRLSCYQIGNLSHARTNDVLKLFYQNLIPETMRKSLGEFYTPDWLVEVVLDKVSGDFYSARFLDPTCGSGSFLLNVINRIRKSGEIQGRKDILDIILNNVWGFDLNPLAVQTARLNYLISIADLIVENPGIEIEIPVLLADAIYSPAPNPDADQDLVTYTIGSQIANLTITIPSQLAQNRDRLDDVFQVMSDSVEQNSSADTMLLMLCTKSILTQAEVNQWEKALINTYDRVLALHRKNWNGIWFRIVRNYFWSATAGEFDVVIGNPPWVRWSKLPELYRERVKPTCIQYDIFSSTPYHGGNELDISAMITFTVSDKWLKKGGQLVFLLTQTLFQSASSAGFRRFRITKDAYLSPLSVSDLKELKPFPSAANKTSILVAKKTENAPDYPVEYNVWHANKGTSRIIPENSTKEDVLQGINIDKNEATPIGEKDSPWAILKPGELSSFQGLLGTTGWASGRKGITCDLNGVYFVKVLKVASDGSCVQIETRPNAGKQNIGPARRFWIEPVFLFPLIKGASEIKPCMHLKPKDQIAAIVPNTGITRAAYELCRRNMEDNNPKLNKYFQTFENMLIKRSTFKTRMKNAPYYAVYNVGNYTFAAWKVVWAEQPGNKKIPFAVINTGSVCGKWEKPFIPDHKVYFADFSEPNKAYYLCGLLNNSIVQRYLMSYLITLQVGDVLHNLKLPDYDENNELHNHLAIYTKRAHEIKECAERDAIMQEIDHIGEKILFC